MSEEREFTKKRLTELAKKSYERGIFTFSDFLGLDELSAFSEIKSSLAGIKYTEFGGTEGAERVMLRFGDEDELGWSEDFPIAVLKIEPRAKRWAERLTHRDLLGALMNLGIERSSLGDIVIRENVAYVFANERIAPFIEESLTRARHTDLTVTRVEAVPDGALYKTEDKTVQCQSARVDAIIARVFSLSRDDAAALFQRKLVFIDGRLTESPSKEPKPHQTVSVRGFGRFVFEGQVGTSKKGKLNLLVRVFV